MQNYQKAFLDFAIKEQVIRFGEFTLKSGRTSPYFFNAGLFNNGESISKLGQFYALALMNSAIEFDLLFGPAYKGIPLVTSTAVALSEHYNKNVPWCFNRKEVKDHGEGGQMVGAKLQGQTVIIDDVITAGTAIREVMDILQPYEAKPAAVMVALDRQEKGHGELSTIQEVEQGFGIPVVSIVTLTNLLNYAESNPAIQQYAPAIRSYRDKYGISQEN